MVSVLSLALLEFWWQYASNCLIFLLVIKEQKTRHIAVLIRHRLIELSRTMCFFTAL